MLRKNLNRRRSVFYKRALNRKTSTQEVAKTATPTGINPESFPEKVISFCLHNKFLVYIAIIGLILWGISVAPFNWEIENLPRNPIPVDAIPDIGENQQIVFTQWMGRSPQDVEDQISYPLTVAMLGIPGVKTVRTYSMFGFSTIYVIFKDNIEFYWSRTRVLEKLNSLPANSLPKGVKPALGPDATALGQIYWYTLEGLDKNGKQTGGWDLQELRSIQDWYVRYSFLSADGISDVGSVGGFVKEYQIDVDPDAMRAYNVTLHDVFQAVKKSNIDVGARTIEVNRAEYVIRGLGFIKNVSDLRKAVVKVRNNVPVYIKDIANVTLGPGLRRGTLDKEGSEAVGGVVVVRYGSNPLAAIKNLKAKIKEIAPSLPSKIIIDYTKVSKTEVEEFAKTKSIKAYKSGEINQKDWLNFLKKNPDTKLPDWLTLSKVTIVPFYDRTKLINETLGTLKSAISEEILVTVIVILFMLMHIRSSMVISLTLPLAVLMCFIAMKIFKVDANIVALSGIVIAIGTIVDMGVIVCENALRHLSNPHEGKSSLQIVYEATSEVAGAITTAVSTTIVSFLPVFTMTGAEGKLFKPLAFTKSFALISSIIAALTVVPVFAHTFFTMKFNSAKMKKILMILLLISGTFISYSFVSYRWVGGIMIIIAIFHLFSDFLPKKIADLFMRLANFAAIIFVLTVLTNHWLPLGPGAGFTKNFVVVTIPIAGLLSFFAIFSMSYKCVLAWCLDNKLTFLSMPVVAVIIGISVWVGFGNLFSWMPEGIRQSQHFTYLEKKFPGLGKEFMPTLDEGSFLYMPTTMPHASIAEVMDVLKKQNIGVKNIPEIESAVGKLGRADTPLDPAPISMIETVINYKNEYITTDDGESLSFKYNPDEIDFFRDTNGKKILAKDGKPYMVQGKFIRDDKGKLIPDKKGMPFRLWRLPLNPKINKNRKYWKGIVKTNDIWNEILEAAAIPGTTSAPKLQPIAARIVMLQSGMRAPMGVKVKGPDLESIESAGLEIEKFLKQVPSVQPAAVFADRIVGKPYLEIEIDRDAIARYGINVLDVQNVIEVAIGGKTITTTVEGRERYPVRVRYYRELRDKIESLDKILVAGTNGQQIPIIQLAKIKYTRGPQVIKSEDTFLIGYVLFDKKPGYAEVTVVEDCQKYLNDKIESGELILGEGISFTFAGNYENQLRAQKTLAIVVPLAMALIFLILYLEFKRISTTLIIFSSIGVACAGGFIMVWFYGQPWFLNFSIMGIEFRDLFQIHEINLSVAIWVGFLALFGIASDNGVVLATYLDQSFHTHKITSIKEIREATIIGSSLRIRPALITTATTILALLPVLTSAGRGSDVMLPMAIPSFGGMLLVLLSCFFVPVLYALQEEIKFLLKKSKSK